MENTGNRINLSVIKRKDAGKRERLYKISYCKLYQYEKGNWKNTGFSGPLFLYRRDGGFYENAMIVMHKKIRKNFVGHFYPSIDTVRKNNNVIMIKTGGHVIKVGWCHDLYWSADFERLMDLIKENLNFSSKSVPKADSFNVIKPVNVITPIKLKMPFEILIQQLRAARKGSNIPPQIQQKNEEIAKVSVASLSEKSTQRSKVSEKQKKSTLKKNVSPKPEGSKNISKIEKKQLQINLDPTAKFKALLKSPPKPKISTNEQTQLPELVDITTSREIENNIAPREEFYPKGKKSSRKYKRGRKRNNKQKKRDEEQRRQTEQRSTRSPNNEQVNKFFAHFVGKTRF